MFLPKGYFSLVFGVIMFSELGENGEDAKNNSTKDWEHVIVRTFIIKGFIVTSNIEIKLGTQPSF